MPNRTVWIHEPYIMRSTFTGIIHIDEVDTLMHDYLKTLAIHDDIYTILDFSRSAAVPTTLLQLDSIIDVIHHDNTRWFTVVNPTGFDSNTTRLLTQDKVKLFDSVDKALGFVRGMLRLDTGINLD